MPRIRHLRPPRPQRPAARRLLRGAAEGHRGVRPRRLLRLSRRRAPFHAARHGALAQRVPLRDRAAHQAAALRHLRLCAAGASSAAHDRGNLHARSPQRRPAGDRLRPRLGALRDFLLRAERRGAPADLCRAAGADPQGVRRRRTSPGRASTTSSRTCRWRSSRCRSRIRRCGTARIRPTAPSAPRARACTWSTTTCRRSTRAIVARYREVWREVHGASRAAAEDGHGALHRGRRHR